MPLIVSEIAIQQAGSADFTNLLRADPGIADTLQQAAARAEGRLFLGIFNSRPVALLRVIPQGSGWKLAEIVVHPATRGRGVGKELVRQSTALLAPDTLDSGPRW